MYVFVCFCMFSHNEDNDAPKTKKARLDDDLAAAWQTCPKPRSQRSDITQ